MGPTAAPTNPKKKSLMTSGTLRRKLRAAGHGRPAIVQVGKDGVTPAVLKQLERALFDHELVKIKLGGETPSSHFEVAERIALQPGTHVVQLLGRTLLVYKRHPHRPRFEGEGAREAAAKRTSDLAPVRQKKKRPKRRSRSREVAREKKSAAQPRRAMRR